MVGEFNENPSAGTVKGTCRFFDNENVKAQELIKPHILQTQKRMERYEYVFAVSDTCYINYNNLKKTAGLGSIGRYRTEVNHSQGIITHVTYAVSPDGLPLGILAVKAWTRPAEGYGPDGRPKENKESRRWTEQMLEASKVYPAKTKMIYVADRESDIYELFEKAREHGIEVVVRSKHDRKVKGDGLHVKNTLSREEAKGRININVNGANNKKRKAALDVKSSEVDVFRPGNEGKGAANRKYEKLNGISVEENNPPSEKEKIQWYLLTTLPAGTIEQCAEVVDTYKERWKIELLFKVMKSGCSVEDCRLQNADRIIRYLFIMFVMAWKLAWKVYINRTDPSGSYSLVVTELEYKTLWLIRNRNGIKRGECGKDPPVSAPWTVRDTVRAIAHIAGFNGRKRDGEPGMQKIWEGWIKLQNATLATEVLL